MSDGSKWTRLSGQPDTNKGSSIFLDDLTELIDIQEDDAGKITKVREHIVIQIHTQLDASTIPDTLSIGVKMEAITYTVGGTSKSRKAPDGVRFMCVQDSVSPIEHPGSMCFRRQTWESFGKFKTPESGWLAD